jgi:serine/threonine protein kinase
MYTPSPIDVVYPSHDPRSAAETPPFRRGERITGTAYDVVDCLGEGGMGEVYEVVHGELGRRFALKVLHRSLHGHDNLEARFREEARVLARLDHPNIVDVVDMGRTLDGRPYFVMELLRGRDLRSELGRFGVVAIPTALGIVVQALDGLAAAHAAGVVHRDIKLENLFLCDDGTVKLVDFGIAKSGLVNRTDHGRAMGTPRSMSPEQYAGGPIDARADLYAIGIVLYELVTGRGPFDEHRGNVQALRYAHCEKTPPLPSVVAPQPMPSEVEALIVRALAKSPSERFQTAAEMAERLRRLRGERRRRMSGAPPAPALRAETPTTQPAERPSAPRWIWLAVAAAALAFTLGRELPSLHPAPLQTSLQRPV